MQHYREIQGISLCEFLPPHLVIYVDQPAEEVQKKLKQSGKVKPVFSACVHHSSYERRQQCRCSQAYLQNVPLTYLKSIEDSYKKTFLPQIR